MVSQAPSEQAVAIGIDIGGTKTALGIVDRSGSILARRRFATETAKGFDRSVRRLCAQIGELFEEAGCPLQRLAGIGVGSTGPLDPVRGTIDNPYTLPTWEGCDIVTPLSEAFGVPTVLENDADAAAYGESVSGAGRGRKRVAMLTLGTGVGGGVILDGEIYRGLNGAHPELGHMTVSFGTTACYCGRDGCLESVASGTAIGAAGEAAGLGDSMQVFLELEKGNQEARTIVDAASRALADAAWTLLHTFAPEVLILGGGIASEHFDLFSDAIGRRLEPATQMPSAAMSVLPARLGNDAGIVGAGTWALKRAMGAKRNSR